MRKNNKICKIQTRKRIQRSQKKRTQRIPRKNLTRKKKLMTLKGMKKTPKGSKPRTSLMVKR